MSSRVTVNLKYFSTLRKHNKQLEYANYNYFGKWGIWLTCGRLTIIKVVLTSANR